MKMLTESEGKTELCEIKERKERKIIRINTNHHRDAEGGGRDGACGFWAVKKYLFNLMSI